MYILHPFLVATVQSKHGAQSVHREMWHIDSDRCTAEIPQTDFPTQLAEAEKLWAIYRARAQGDALRKLTGEV